LGATTAWVDIPSLAQNKGIDIGKFGPGVYELRVSVKDPRSNKPVQRTAVFSVE
jgi:hypothetical protein